MNSFELFSLACQVTLAAALSPLMAETPILVSARVPEAPNVDGKADDAAWKKAQPLTVTAKRVLPPNVGKSTEAAIRSVHTETHVYFLMTWTDETESVSHKSWVWNADKKAYEQGEDREDMFALAFEHTGDFNADMFAGIESIWDVWHWKAFRTNPKGYAMDKTHHYTKAKPEGKAREYKDRNGKEIWIARPEDAGETVERKQPAPAEFKGERFPQYVAAKPSGSASDLPAKGAWANGKWTLEIGRKLDTGNKDDTAFDINRTYRMSLAPFDATGDMDKAARLILLRFEGKAGVGLQQDFEGELAGNSPAGFSVARTGKGAEGKWLVQEAADAPSGKKVLMQTSGDQTNYRFPVCVNDGFVAKDVDLTVKFKPISGRVDQAAGIVWRYADVDNYYIVRANALEDNVVLYKVEDGRRSDLKPKGAGGFAYGKKVEVPGRRWSTLRVAARGNTFEVFLNDAKLYEVEDDTFKGAGKVGLWTKADSVTQFDDLKAVSLEK